VPSILAASSVGLSAPRVQPAFAEVDPVLQPVGAAGRRLCKQVARQTQRVRAANGVWVKVNQELASSASRAGFMSSRVTDTNVSI
jgi:hypothetical protein